MKLSHKTLLIAMASLAWQLSELPTAQAQQPPDNVASDAHYNTSMGTNALFNMLAGAHDNTAAGEGTLVNSSGGWNTAVGSLAMHATNSGSQNAAFGAGALYWNTTGSNNTASGVNALFHNATGYDNTASGNQALFSNTTGIVNTAFGFEALYANTTGWANTASGYAALNENTAGSYNDASGWFALGANTTGNYNSACGPGALFSNTVGSYNTAVGFKAGYNQTTGHDNIYVANLGVGGESQVMRLGSQGTAGSVGSGVLTTYVAGIFGSPVTGSVAAVYVTPTGQLGVLASSERYKTDVVSMESNSSKLAQLRPVKFKLKTDPQGVVQYGLIAEEVDRVYPELVIHNTEGRIEGVRYEELAPMLLKEVQQQQQKFAAQEERIAAQAQQLSEVQKQLAEVRQLKEQLTAFKARGGAARLSPVNLPASGGL